MLAILSILSTIATVLGGTPGTPGTGGTGRTGGSGSAPWVAQTKDVERYTEFASAITVSNKFHLQDLFDAIYLNTLCMKTTLKQYFGTQSLNIQRYHSCRRAFEDTMNQIRVSSIYSTENTGLEKSTNEIEHEVACMDETIECFLNLTCNSTRKQFQECVTFTWETYLDEVLTIQLAVSGILSELENPNNISFINRSIISRAEDLKERFRRIKAINTEKWKDLKDFRLVLVVIKCSTGSFEKLESHLKSAHQSNTSDHRINQKMTTFVSQT